MKGEKLFNYEDVEPLFSVYWLKSKQSAVQLSERSSSEPALDIPIMNILTFNSKMKLVSQDKTILGKVPLTFCT